MMKLNEKSNNVFLSGKGKENVAELAFTALKAALGDTALTEENFKQFSDSFAQYINAAKVEAAPAADNENPEDGADTDSSGQTDSASASSSSTSAPAEAPADAPADGAAPVSESITHRTKPSSLLFGN